MLEIDKQGPKLSRTEGEDPEIQTSIQGSLVTYTFGQTDMDSLVRILARQVDLPVANGTGMKGNFNFTLHWTQDTAVPSKDVSIDDVSIFAALREQLGLRLRPTKTPMEILVIDHVERPSAN